MNSLANTCKRMAISGSHGPVWRPLWLRKTGLTNNNLLQVRLRSTAEATPLPKFAQASIWTSIVPRFLRSRSSNTSPSSQTPLREWNPATFYIVIFTLIGSQAIQMLVLRKNFEAYSRKSEAKLRLLTEVIENIKQGRNVDVERMLGTGDEVKEREWEEVLREIEDEDSMWRQKSLDQRRNSSPEPSDEKNDIRNDAGTEKEKPTKSDPSPNEPEKKLRFY